MGYRSSFVVVANERPEMTLDYIRSLEPREYLIDNVFCEGGILLDMDHKKVLFFADVICEDEVPGITDIFLEMVKFKWSNWDIEYTANGVLDFGRYVKLDKITLQDLDASARMDGLYFEEDDPLLEIRISKFEAEDCQRTLITIQYKKSTIKDYGTSFNAVSVLCLGSEFVNKFQTKKSRKIESAVAIHESIFIDPSAKKVEAWVKEEDFDKFYSLFVQKWPGYQILENKKGLTHHYRLSGKNPNDALPTKVQIIEFITKEIIKDIRDNYKPLDWLKAITKEVPDGKVSRSAARFVRPKSE